MDQRALFQKMLTSYDEDQFALLSHRFLPQRSLDSRDKTVSLLADLFSEEIVRKRVVDLLNEDDLSMLLLVLLFSPRDIESAASMLHRGSHQSMVLRLTDLCDRLILTKGKKENLAINPLLDDAIEKELALSSLFGQRGPKARVTPFVGRDMIRGFLSLGSGKNSEEKARLCFPFAEPRLFPILETTLTEMGITAVGPALEALTDHDDLAIAVTLLAISSSLPYRKMLDLVTLLSLLDSVDHSHFDQLCAYLGLDGKLCLEQLLLWSLAEDDGTFVIAHKANEEERKELLFDSDKSITYRGRGKKDDLLPRFATLEKLDTMTIWKVDRESLLRGFDQGLEPQVLLDYLEREGGGCLVQEVLLASEAYNSFSLTHCIALNADERVSRIIASVPAFMQHCLSRPAPSLFLMDATTYAKWSVILRQCFGVVPSLRGEKLIPVEPIEEHPVVFDDEPSVYASLSLLREAPEKSSVYDLSLRETIKAMQIDAKKKDWMLHLYSARRIISESQLSGLSDELPVEVVGFDYQGKLQFLKHVLRQKTPSLLEVEIDEVFSTIIPMELVKMTDDSMMLRAEDKADGSLLLLPVGKMYVIRQLSPIR